MNLGKRVQQRRYELNMTMRDLAEKVGISHSAISVMESRDQKSSHYANNLAEALGVSVEWLLNGEEPKLAPQKPIKIEDYDISSYDDVSELPDSHYVLIPFIEVIGGKLINTEKNKSISIAALSQQGIKSNQLRFIKACGDDMSPVIEAGYDLLIDLSKTEITDGKIYAFMMNDYLYTKRVFQTYNGGLKLLNENPDYPELIVPPEDRRYITIIGCVIYLEGFLR